MTKSSTTPMTTSTTTPPRGGACVCGTPVADHFDSNNRTLTCEAARSRWQTRLDVERSHVELLMSVIATIWCVRLGRHIVTSPALGTLEPHQQDDVRLFAQMVLTSLDPARRRVARERAIDRGVEELRQTIGRVELSERACVQLRMVLGGVLTSFTHSLQGLDPITDYDVARLQGARQAAPADVLEFPAPAAEEVQ